MKIGLVGLMFDQNLGDPLMLECLETLYKKELLKREINDYTFSYIDLFGRESNEKLIDFSYSKLNKIHLIFYKILSRLTKNKFDIANNYFEDKKYQIDINGEKRLRKLFKQQLKDIDYLVVVGGALVKFRLIRNFHIPLLCLIDEANKLGINVVFNAVGIENGYDIRYHGCKIVKKYLNYPNIKLISTRDDIETLKKYVGSNKEICITSDSAIFCDEIFDISPNTTSDIIGIGVIDPVRFMQYNDEDSMQKYKELIYNLLILLDKKKYKWKLFTNGHSDDYKFAEELILKLGKDKSYIVERATNYIDLVDTINSFRLIVASRLHACIIGYGLNKQILGIDWNNKLLYFGELINSSESFFKPIDISAQDAMKLIEIMYYRNYNQEERAQYRNKIKETISREIDLIEESRAK